MRWLLLVLVLLPGALAEHPLTVELSDWQEGRFLVGTPVVAGIDEARFALDVPACHRVILLDVLYAPNETMVGAEGVGEVALLHELRATLVDANGTVVAEARIAREGYGHVVGLAPAAGEHELRLGLRSGALVDYSARVRGKLVQNEPECSHVVE